MLAFICDTWWQHLHEILSFLVFSYPINYCMYSLPLSLSLPVSPSLCPVSPSLPCLSLSQSCLCLSLSQPCLCLSLSLPYLCLSLPALSVSASLSLCPVSFSVLSLCPVSISSSLSALSIPLSLPCLSLYIVSVSSSLSLSVLSLFLTAAPLSSLHRCYNCLPQVAVFSCTINSFRLTSQKTNIGNWRIIWSVVRTLRQSLLYRPSWERRREIVACFTGEDTPGLHPISGRSAWSCG